MRVLILLLTITWVNVLHASYSPIIDGALADIKIKVVDENGEVVAGATVSVAFYTAPEKSNVRRGQTDSLGCFSAKSMCTGEAHAWIYKTGYYDTKVDPIFKVLPYEDVWCSRKWSNGVVETTVTLKRKKKPVNLEFHQLEYKKFPATNEVVKLDLEMLDWCPPYGNGRHDDVHMIFDGWRNPDDWYDFHEHLLIMFPNCVDGFYVRKVNPTSDFQYDYVASKSDKYEKKKKKKNLEFRFSRVKNGVTNYVSVAQDEYLIYRVRTQTNELGQVTYAHYGRIGEGISQKIGLSIRSWFNQKACDMNLEDSRLW